MPRASRFAPGGYVDHALQRAVARLPLFEKAGDCAAFQRVLVEAQARCPIRILGDCLMSNRWHFVLWPARDGALAPAGSCIPCGSRRPNLRCGRSHFLRTLTFVQACR